MAAHGEGGKAADLLAIGEAAVVLSPRGLLRMPEKVVTRNMVTVPCLGLAHTAEKLLSPVRAGAVEAVSLLMVDQLHLETVVQIGP